MNWLLRRHTIHGGFRFVAAAALVGPPLATLELLCLVAIVSGEPLVWFKPESREFLIFAAVTYLAGGFILATVTALLLLWRRRPSLIEAQLLTIALSATGPFLLEPGRLSDGPAHVALQVGVLALVMLPATLGAGWVATRWGAFRPLRADPAPHRAPP